MNRRTDVSEGAEVSKVNVRMIVISVTSAIPRFRSILSLRFSR